jgi:hypothetical protein
LNGVSVARRNRENPASLNTRGSLKAIEQRHPDRLGKHVERLAHHAFRAEEWDTAVGDLRQSGTKP